MNIKTFLAVIFVIGISMTVASQTTDCMKDFDYLIKKIQSDYPGYNDKVTNANRLQLKTLEKEIRQKITNHPDSCGYYLSEYTDFFKDRHLRIIPNRKRNNQQAEIMDVSTYGKNLYINTDSLQQAKVNEKGIEGVWEGFWEKIVVTKDEGKYVGIAVNNQRWKSGQVLYEFEPVNDTVFNVINHSLVKNRQTYKTKASLHLNGKVIEFQDKTHFIRKTDSDTFDKATLYSYVPLYPNGTNVFYVAMYLDDSTFFLRIPGFDDDYANEMVQKHWDEIMTRPNLIIDIRYNGGGQDEYYSELAKIIYTKPYESKGVEWYATKGIIKHIEDDIKNGEIEDGENMIWTQVLLAAMKKNIGGFVTHPYSINDNSMVERDKVYPMPRHVGIIINEDNASSAEQFLLDAKESDKVILFGNSNTAGILDYSNAAPTPLPSDNYRLLYPWTRSKRLPENPIDNIGIAPDVVIPFPATEQLYDKLDTWVYFVKKYLEFLDK